MKRFTIYHLLFTIGLLVFCSCSKREYLNVIPQNPAFVVSVDFNTIAEKGEISQSPYLPQVTSLLGGMSDKFSDYMENPEKMGIDFRQPACFFGDGSYFAMTMAVYDADDLADFFTVLHQQNACGPLTEKDGVQYAKIQGAKGVVAFNKNTLLIISSSPEFACQLLAQQQENSFTATDAYDHMADLEGEILMYGNAASVPSKAVSDMKLMLPEGIRYTDVDVYGSTLFADGSIIVRTQLRGKTKEAQRLIEDGNDTEQFKKIKGDYIERAPEDFFLWACVGVEKGGLLNMLKSSNYGHQLLLVLERAIDIEQILRQVKGDAVIMVPRNHKMHGYEQFMFISTVDDTDFMKDVDYWQKSMADFDMSMSRTIGDNFVLKAGIKTFNWGLEGDQFYFATDDMFAQNATAQRSNLLKSLEKDICSSYFYAYINFEPLLKDTNMTPAQCAFPIPPFLWMLKSVIFQSKEYGTLDIAINLKDESQNSLKTIFHATDTTH